MKAFLIDPHQKTVTEVEHAGGLDSLYKLTHCDIVEAVHIGRGDVIYVDEEGLFKPLAEQAFFVYEGYPQPLAGYGLIVGTTRGGNDAAPKITLEAAQGKVQFLSLEQVRRFVQ